MLACPTKHFSFFSAIHKWWQDGSTHWITPLRHLRMLQCPYLTPCTLLLVAVVLKQYGHKTRVLFLGKSRGKFVFNESYCSWLGYKVLTTIIEATWSFSLWENVMHTCLTGACQPEWRNGWKQHVCWHWCLALYVHYSQNIGFNLV